MMSEDIRKWSDGRYTLMFDEHTFFVFDNEKEKQMTALQTTKKLNEQQEEMDQLQKSVEYWQKKYEQGTETLEIGEQQSTIQSLKEENEKLRNKLEVANARSGYYQRMLEKWCVKDE